MSGVDPRAVAHAAALARLPHGAASDRRLLEQVERILAFVSQIEGVATETAESDLDPTARPWSDAAIAHPLRPDLARRADPPLDLTREAPEAAEGFVLVPRMKGMGPE